MVDRCREVVADHRQIEIVILDVRAQHDALRECIEHLGRARIGRHRTSPGRGVLVPTPGMFEGSAVPPCELPKS